MQTASRTALLAAVLTPILALTGMSAPAQATGQHAPSSPPIASDAPFTPKIKSLLYADAPGRPAGEGPLTVDEKISLVHGARPDPLNVGSAGYTPGVPRLGIPARRDADALGINVAAQTSAPPTKMGIAASFDRGAAVRLGLLEGVEGRASNVDVLYGPQLDVARIPGAARNQTTAGEDPYLITELGTAEINAIQSQGLMSEAKHFILYNQSTNTGGGGANLNVVADEQTLHEIYLPPFAGAVQRAGISSVMCSYQKSYGKYMCEQPALLNDVLRGELGFKGFVLSDYGATHSLSILQGLDTQFPTGTFFDAQLKALADPASPTYDPQYAQALDTSVARILYEYERFGLLNAQAPARPTLSKAAGIATTRDLAEDSAVLLKNDSKILPLSSGLTKDAVVIGATGRQLLVGLGGERSRGFADRDAISPLDALRSAAPRGSRIAYSPGVDWLGDVVPASALPGGLSRTDTVSGQTLVESTLNHTASNPLQPGATYTWTGTLNAPATDTYRLSLQRSATDATLANPASIGTVTLAIDGVPQTLANPVPGGPVPIITTPDGLFNTGVELPLPAGAHTVTISYTVPTQITNPVQAAGPTPPVQLRFTWSPIQATIAAAAVAARRAKVAVVFANDSPGGNATPDRDPATLQSHQDDLIAAVAKANRNTVVVLNTGSAVTMPWAGDVKAILEMWYPGQEGGTATANLLLGKSSPGGRLPITFPVSGADTQVAGHPERWPGLSDATGQPTTTGPATETYSEGIFVGYRWYDEQAIAPLYPFGHGLTYSSFDYSRLEVDSSRDGGLDVRFRVRNTGRVIADEVPQVYLGRPPSVPAGVQAAPKTLAGFERITLRPGQSVEVNVHITARSLSYWSTADHAWKVGTGERQILVGRSSRDVELSTSRRVTAG